MATVPDATCAKPKLCDIGNAFVFPDDVAVYVKLYYSFAYLFPHIAYTSFVKRTVVLIIPLCTPLKIINTIVTFNLILMIYIRKRFRVIYKRFCDKPMYF